METPMSVYERKLALSNLDERQKNILREKIERELKEDVLEDIGRDSTTDPERMHSAEEYFNSEEYNEENNG